MASKIQIKAGNVEFIYEGESELSFDEIKELFSHIEAIYSKSINEVEIPNQSDLPLTDNVVVTQPNEGNNIELHINSVAEKLGVKTGTEMALAAAAYIQICEGKDSFSRTDLNTTMRKANTYFKENMTRNLTPSIKTLLKTKINQLSNDKYSLKADAINELKLKLD